MGFAFKANTNDTRESAAIRICKDLIIEGAEIVIHDPKVSPQQIENDLQIKEFPKNEKEKISFKGDTLGKWRFSRNLNIFDNAHAVLVLTEWDQ